MEWKNKLKRSLLHRLSKEQLKYVTGAVGVVTVVNIFLPDFLPFLDEFAMIWVLIELMQETRQRGKGRRAAIDVDPS